MSIKRVLTTALAIAIVGITGLFNVKTLIRASVDETPRVREFYPVPIERAA